jgi:hypothetical protein
MMQLIAMGNLTTSRVTQIILKVLGIPACGLD